MNKRLENRIVYLEQLRKGPTGVSALSDAELHRQIAFGVAERCAEIGLATSDLSVDQLVDIGRIWKPAFEASIRGSVTREEAAERLREAYDSVTQPRPSAQPGG